MNKDKIGNDKKYFPLLDVLRGPAAMLVFAEHWRNLFFVDFGDLDRPGAVAKVFYLFTGAGHQAVMIFFVLSGCVIAHVMQTMIDHSKWSWSAYLSARLTRLWVVLIPSLVLTAGWDFLGISFTPFSESIYTGMGFGNVMNTPVSESSGLVDFVGNTFFLQTILVPTFGSNGPLWSIAFEFAYYLAFPALLIACFFDSSTLRRVLLAVFAVLLLCFCGRAIASSFPIFLAGVLSYAAYRKLPAFSKIALPGFLIGTFALVACVVASRIPTYSGAGDWNWLIAASTAIALYFGLSVDTSKRLMFILRPFHGLSAVSYSVYLLHMPLLVFISSRFFGAESTRWVPDVENLLAASGIGAIVFAYCLLIWFITEHQTRRFRAWCKGLFGFRKHVAKASG